MGGMLEIRLSLNTNKNEKLVFLNNMFSYHKMSIALIFSIQL